MLYKDIPFLLSVSRWPPCPGVACGSLVDYLSYLLRLLFQLVSEDNFEVQRRACVELDLSRFLKKSWQKGLPPDSISVLAGERACVHACMHICVCVCVCVCLFMLAAASHNSLATLLWDRL